MDPIKNGDIPACYVSETQRVGVNDVCFWILNRGHILIHCNLLATLHVYSTVYLYIVSVYRVDV